MTDPERERYLQVIQNQRDQMKGLRDENKWLRERLNGRPAPSLAPRNSLTPPAGYRRCGKCGALMAIMAFGDPHICKRPFPSRAASAR